MARTRGITRSMLVGAGAVALVAVTAGPAAADSGATLWTIWPDRRAHATFTSHGDVFEVWDDEGDGAAAIVWWEVGSRSGYCTNDKGAGTKHTCNLDFGEGKTIRWGLWAWDQDGQQSGHQWVSATQTDRT